MHVVLAELYSYGVLVRRWQWYSLFVLFASLCRWLEGLGYTLVASLGLLLDGFLLKVLGTGI